ncbi:uncharacterized protein LOC127810940 isoform X2 [Diospyros lotus]|uniref:uncharacterized protein LOC127810940 isoform X2 n=1 Tax=Diospyros lotus TaxID=55363 RepID=UPI002258D53C|nr:uncharacterized protein LOC127810940 isoform X2 [Diospyros lotus]
MPNSSFRWKTNSQGRGWKINSRHLGGKEEDAAAANSKGAEAKEKKRGSAAGSRNEEGKLNPKRVLVVSSLAGKACSERTRMGAPMEATMTDNAVNDNSEDSRGGGRSRNLPRLFIKEMVLRNFKSYAGEQRVGPFHKLDDFFTKSHPVHRFHFLLNKLSLLLIVAL